MPAEWAPHTQTWMIWPERPDNWRLNGKPAQAAFTTVAQVIARFEAVTVGASATALESARAQLNQSDNQPDNYTNIRVVEITTDDA